MLSPENLRAAAELLWRHWQAGTLLPALPENLRPAGRREGYAIQALLESRTARPLYGWKIAATSRAGQQHIGVDGPLAGRLLAERCCADGAEVPFAPSHMRVIEPEFAFRMARDLPPRVAPYSAQEVLAAVESLHPAIEIPDSRFEDFTRVGAAQLIADDACAHRFVLGPAAPSAWRDANLVAHRVWTTVADSRGQVKLQREGSGANVLGDPRIALTWLVNELSPLGIPLRGGQVVTTGTCAVPLPAAAGDAIRADFGSLGLVSTRFASA
jgi:2-keto-4-pentenoate hydratase